MYHSPTPTPPAGGSASPPDIVAATFQWLTNPGTLSPGPSPTPASGLGLPLSGLSSIATPNTYTTPHTTHYPTDPTVGTHAQSAAPGNTALAPSQHPLLPNATPYASVGQSASSALPDTSTIPSSMTSIPITGNAANLPDKNVQNIQGAFPHDNSSQRDARVVADVDGSDSDIPRDHALVPTERGVGSGGWVTRSETLAERLHKLQSPPIHTVEASTASVPEMMAVGQPMLLPDAAILSLVGSSPTIEAFLKHLPSDERGLLQGYTLVDLNSKRAGYFCINHVCSPTDAVSILTAFRLFVTEERNPRYGYGDIMTSSTEKRQSVAHLLMRPLYRSRRGGEKHAAAMNPKLDHAAWPVTIASLVSGYMQDDARFDVNAHTWLQVADGKLVVAAPFDKLSRVEEFCRGLNIMVERVGEPARVWHLTTEATADVTADAMYCRAASRVVDEGNVLRWTMQGIAGSLWVRSAEAPTDWTPATPRFTMHGRLFCMEMQVAGPGHGEGNGAGAKIRVFPQIGKPPTRPTPTPPPNPPQSPRPPPPPMPRVGNNPPVRPQPTVNVQRLPPRMAVVAMRARNPPTTTTTSSSGTTSTSSTSTDTSSTSVRPRARSASRPPSSSTLTTSASTSVPPQSTSSSTSSTGSASSSSSSSSSGYAWLTADQHRNAKSLSSPARSVSSGGGKETWWAICVGTEVGVRKGKWAEVERLVTRFSGAKYKSYPTEAAAVAAYAAYNNAEREREARVAATPPTPPPPPVPPTPPKAVMTGPNPVAKGMLALRASRAASASARQGGEGRRGYVGRSVSARRVQEDAQ